MFYTDESYLVDFLMETESIPSLESCIITLERYINLFEGKLYIHTRETIDLF